MKKQIINRKLCKQPKMPERVFDLSVSAHRKGFILSNGLKWVNGTVITYLFLEGAEAQRKVVLKAFQTWKDVGIGISFKEVLSVDDSMVRIGFDLADGSWSYVGRDILTIPKNQKTMNFGWDLTVDSYGMTTAIHEIGHTLGFQHEHQSPFSGIEWNVEAVYKAFSAPPNSWPKSEIDSNIINKMPPNQVMGSTWDPDSIMEYEFDAGMISKPAPYDKGLFPPGVLSLNDKKGVKLFYPIVAKNSFINLEVHKSELITASSGMQSDYIFKAPSTKKYTFQTIGEMDSVMVIFEKGKKENSYLSGDDNSGFEKNSLVTLPLIKDREYIINVRVLFAPNVQSGSIIVS